MACSRSKMLAFNKARIFGNLSWPSWLSFSIIAYKIEARLVLYWVRETSLPCSGLIVFLFQRSILPGISAQGSQVYRLLHQTGETSQWVGQQVSVLVLRWCGHSPSQRHWSPDLLWSWSSLGRQVSVQSSPLWRAVSVSWGVCRWWWLRCPRQVLGHTVHHCSSQTMFLSERFLRWEVQQEESQDTVWQEVPGGSVHQEGDQWQDDSLLEATEGGSGDWDSDEGQDHLLGCSGLETSGSVLLM